jgi:CheY-like chemotaxis protein
MEPVRYLMRRILEEGGYRVCEAAEGKEALTVLARIAVDVIVTDLRMPGMDGWELADRLASRSPRIPLLFISAYDVHADTGDLPGPVLGKPFMPEALLASVGKLLEGARPAGT